MLNKFVDETNDAKKSVKDNVSVTNEQINAYKKVVKTLEQVASGTMNTKQQQVALSSSVKELKIQWANLSNTAKSGEFGKMLSSTLVESQSALGQLTNQIKQAESELGNFGGSSVKRQLMDLTKNLTNLTAQYRAMSAAEKASASGRELAQKLSDLREKAGSLKDTVGDVQQEIKTLASDTPNLDVFSDLVGLSADALSTYSSIIARVTGDEKALKDAIATVMAVQSAANLLTKVTNALQSSSAIMLKIRAIQEKAAAAAISIKSAAEGKSVIATKAATVAQKAFNAVAKANPYVLLATAIIGVGAALYAFTRNSSKAEAAERASKEAAEQAQKSWDDFKNSASNAGASLLSTYTKLQSEWNSLKSAHEKNQWIKDNKTEFNKLGVEVENVADAENFLVNNTDKVVQAFMLRAKAAAYAAKAQEMWGKYIEKEMEYNRKRVAAGDQVPKSAQPSGVTRDRNGHGNTANGGRYNVNNALTITSFTQKGADEYNNKLRAEIGLSDEAQSEIKAFTQNQVQLEQDAQKLLKSGGIKTKTNTNTTKGGRGSRNGNNAPGFSKGSLSDLENKLSELQKKYKDGLLPNLTTDEYLKQVDNLKLQIQNKKIELGLIPVLPEGSIAKIDEEISDKSKELKLAIDDASRKKIQDEIDFLTGKKEAIYLYLKPAIDKKGIEDINKTISEYQEKPIKGGNEDKVESLKEELDFYKSIISSASKEYDIIQQRVKLGATLTDDENKLVSIYDNAIDKVKELSNEYKVAADNANKLKANSELKKSIWKGVKEGVGTLGDLNGAVTNVGGTWKNLTENWEDMSSFEQVTSAFDATISTIESVIGAIESIGSMIQAFQGISNAYTQQKITNDQAETQSEIGKLGVKEASAIGNATESGSKLPFPANIAAIAAGIAAVVAGFAMVFNCFADGGIVGNGSKIGDYNIARVNGGEMILNGTQQKRLFNLLNSGTGFTSGRSRRQDVNFVIKGKNLKGTLRNFDSMTGRI